MAQIERLGRISEQFLVARKCVFAWKMLRKWHKKQKKPLLGAKSLGRLFYQNNLPNMAAGEGFEPSHTESESAVLPLHNPAKSKDYYTFFYRFVKSKFQDPAHFLTSRYRCSRRTQQNGHTGTPLQSSAAWKQQAQHTRSSLYR